MDYLIEKGLLSIDTHIAITSSIELKRKSVIVGTSGQIPPIPRLLTRRSGGFGGGGCGGGGAIDDGAVDDGGVICISSWAKLDSNWMKTWLA